MSRRLQVLLDESEIADIRRIAHCHHLTVAEWVRHTLREARQRESGKTTEEKLEAVRRGIGHDFPAGDIDEILHEIGSGYCVDRDA